VTPAPAAPAAKIAPAPPAIKVAPVEPAKKKEEEKKVVAPPSPAAKVPEAAAIASATARPATNKNKKVRLAVAAALGMLVLVGGFLFVYPALLHRGTSQTAAQQDSSPLGLRIERTGGGLLLSWNNHSPVIQHASKVVLSITDGDRHENIEMDPNQVRTGSIVYPPISGDVSFQMEVADANQSRTTSESLRVHDPRPSPLTTSSVPATQGPQPTTKQNPLGKGPTPDSASTAAAPADASAKPPEEQAVVHNATPTKQFDKESLAQRLRPAAPAEMADAPAEVRANASAPGNLGSIMSGSASAPSAPVTPARPADTSANNTAATRAPANGGSGGQITPAEPTYKKAPEYPKVARQIGAAGIVEIEAIIGTDGKVRNAKVTKGNPMLQKAAIDAVMEWKYKPALLNGKPVESPVQIKLNFTPDR
jgi:protein TonB